MWTAAKTAKQISNGEICVSVKFTNTVTGESFDPGPYRHTAPPDRWPDDLINARLDQLNALNLDAIALGAPSAKPDAPAPTQDELDRAAFIDLCHQYREALAEVVTGVGKSTQADVDALRDAIKTTYKDEYASLIVGLF